MGFEEDLVRRMHEKENRSVFDQTNLESAISYGKKKAKEEQEKRDKEKNPDKKDDKKTLKKKIKDIWKKKKK